MLASIMMVTYNRWELTEQTLDSLVDTTDYPFELIIVDNFSTDYTNLRANEIDHSDTETNLERYVSALFQVQDQRSNPSFKSYQIIKNTENKGIAIGRNQALKEAKGDWLVTLDNDVLLPNNWLSKSIEILTQVPKYGMLGVNFEGVNYPIVKSTGLEWQEKPTGNLGTACTVFNRSLQKMLGFYNTEYKNYGHEDADFGMRVRVLGLKMGYLKENGIHLGEGENDTGVYREFKNKFGKENLDLFKNNCKLYVTKQKSLYIPFKS